MTTSKAVTVIDAGGGTAPETANVQQKVVNVQIARNGTISLKCVELKVPLLEMCPAAENPVMIFNRVDSSSWES